MRASYSTDVPSQHHLNSLCRSILTRPAKVSEERALIALDPSSYAALALQDADAALRFDADNAHAHVLRVCCLQ